MRATVERLRKSRVGDTYLVTIRFEGGRERVHTYRVSAMLFAEAGAPEEGQALEGETLLMLTEAEDRRLAVERAVRILAAGDCTEAALVRKLCERGFSEDAARGAATRMCELGYIKEEELLLRQLALYAKKGFGPRKALPALLRKGFSRERIHAALARAREEGVYDPSAIKARILSDAPEDAEARRTLLFKHGF